MHDINAIRKDPQAYDRNWARRGMPAQTPGILHLDEKRRTAQTEMQHLQQQRNEASKQIGILRAKGDSAESLMQEVASLKDRLTILEGQESTLGEELNTVLSSLPNMMDPTTPDGPDETANVELSRWGEPKPVEAPKDHVDIGEAMGMMDFASAAKVSGSRFTVLTQQLARLERALAQFMLDTHTQEHGYHEVSPPYLVNTASMYGTGQLPKFQDDQFETTDGRWLIPTSEVVLTNLVRDDILDAAQLPLRLTAFTPCFRKESGAAGKDTRGMIRVHQFFKVELVSITHPDQSVEEHERMTGCAEAILKKLELPYRKIVLCTGDSGFSARKTYDLEVWVPSQDKYREVSSCSNCGDFQARRMKTRFRAKGDKETQFVHTLNGSGTALSRAYVAILENYYDPLDGGVFVPDVLKPYMGGIKKIMPLKDQGKPLLMAAG